MKKLALAVIATAFIAIGHSPVSAQTSPPVCSERDNGSPLDGDGIPTDPVCADFYVAAAPPVAPPAVAPPAVAPPAVLPPVVVPEVGLPRTGSSVSPLLGLGGALLVGGGIIVVATRRRSTATAS